MAFLDTLRDLILGPGEEGIFLEHVAPRELSDPVADAINVRRATRLRPWSSPSVAVAMGVPANLRAVSLISSTTGMLSVQGYRNGVLMRDPPRLIARPDPDQTPYAFYAGTAANLAKYGEFVWWIASRDNDGLPAAMVNVPLRELSVTENAEDRRRPKYVWGTTTGTRYSPANPTGAFVHHLYPVGEPYELRGQGPLQICGAAASVAVESQEWAANFYARGGYPREVVKYAGALDPTPKDEVGLPDMVNGLSEADRFKVAYATRDNNTPIIIDESIESITVTEISEGQAQALAARLHNNGDTARMFGLPGHFVEYVQSGTSLTYQTLETAFTDLVKTCLQPLYLEPIEQAMSDLLTRSTVARFNIRGFLRADSKTRAEIYNLLVPLGVLSVEQAQAEEGYAPGDVEYAPVPPAQPGIVPGPIRRFSEVRCPSCRKLVARSLGPGSELDCPRCKTLVRVA